MQSDGSKEKLLPNTHHHNHNHNTNQYPTVLLTNRQSPSKLNSYSSHKPVMINDKPNRINHSEHSNDSTKDLLSPGDLVKDRWRIVCKLGGGGFGEIYEAIDTKLERIQHSSSSTTSSTSSSSHGNELLQLNLKRHNYTEYSLCLNCATNSTLNMPVHSLPTGQNGSQVIKLKQQDIGSDSGIAGVQACSLDTPFQNGARIHSAGTTTSASLSSRHFMHTSNEYKPNRNNNHHHHQQEDRLLQKINTQDFTVSNASTPRDNFDKKSIVCMNCKCELPSQGCNDKYPMNCGKYESNGVSSTTDSEMSSLNNDFYDYRVAIKAESVRRAKQVLRMEVSVLRRLQGKSNICRLFGCGKNAKFNYMVMTLQGKNLSELRRTLPGAIFTLGTAFRLIKQCIIALQYLHDAGFLHRDVKPANFAIQHGKPKDNSHRVQVTLLDFGLARQYTTNGPGSDVRNARQIVGFRGTVRYASINAHAHQELARRDDLWSLVYMFIEFVCGRLPWKRIRDKELVGQMKIALNHKELAIKSGLPMNIVSVWITHLEQLEYKTMPNYELLITCLDEWLIQHHIDESNLYDWENPLPGSSLVNDTNSHQQHQQQQPGTITLYKPDQKPLFSEQFNHKEVRTPQHSMNQMNVDENIVEQLQQQQNQLKEGDHEVEDEEYVHNKMNETLKPNTLLQIVRDNQLLKLKQSTINLNNRHSTSQCNLITNSRSTVVEIGKKFYDNKLLKQKNLLKNYGSLGVDLSSHDGDMENAIIVEEGGDDYSRSRHHHHHHNHNKLSTVHNSADCILIDDDQEDDVKAVTEMDLLPVNTVNDDDDDGHKHALRMPHNQLTNSNVIKNSVDHFEENLTENDEKNVEILPNKSESSCINGTNTQNSDRNVNDIKMMDTVKECLKVIYAKPIPNGQDQVSSKETIGSMKDPSISRTNHNMKEANQSSQDNKSDVDGQSLYMPSVNAMNSSTLPPTSDCGRTNPREKIHAIIQNLLARRQSEENVTSKLSDGATSRRSPNWSESINNTRKFSEINSSNLDLRVEDSDVDKLICQSDRQLFDQTSPYYIHFALGNNTTDDNEQYHRFLRVPRKDHLSLSTLRLNRTRKSVSFDRSNPTFECNFMPDNKHDMTTSSDQILNDHLENTSRRQNFNSQSNNQYPVPRTKRTLYLNTHYSDQSIRQPTQNLSIKSINIPQNKHENLKLFTKSSYQTNLPIFESTAENYRQKLIDNKHKQCQQKIMNSTKLLGPTIRPVLEKCKTIHQNLGRTNNLSSHNNGINNLKRSESLEKFKKFNSLAKTSNTQQLKANNKAEIVLSDENYERSEYHQQTFLRPNITTTSSTINQLLKSQCLVKTNSEISNDSEIKKLHTQHDDNRSKRMIGKDSMITANQSTAQPIRHNYSRSTLKSSNLYSAEKLLRGRNDDEGDDMKEKQTSHLVVNYAYSPLKSTSGGCLLGSTSPTTNLTDERSILSKSIHYRQSTETSASPSSSSSSRHRRRRLNSIHVVPSELYHYQQRNPQFPLSMFDNNNTTTNNNNSTSTPSHISKVNLRTLRSQSADRVLKSRTACCTTTSTSSFQTAYLLQSTLSNHSSSLSRSKSKPTSRVTMNDFQKTYKLNSLTSTKKF
ncbi:unnamed protein product [Schistosoma turkestanicum]|nr:unnamed protein product [Schistosoma turkestanicum]